MDPWLETVGAAALAVGGIFFARYLARLPKHFWMIGFAISLAIILLFAIQRYVQDLDFIPPFSWIATGRVRFLLGAIVGPVLILTPAASLPNPRLKIMLAIFTAVFLLQFSVCPFLWPALIRHDLSILKTNVDSHGICLQQTDYTCGPAAAVTGLRKLGLPAEEGQIAIWAQTSKFGTTPDVLSSTLNSHYGSQGLTAHFRAFNNLAQLKDAGLTLAVIKYDFMLDHFVTVLEVNDDHVIIGDPLTGRSLYSHPEFLKVWRFTGITLNR